jgi:hypothetical protein
MGSYLLPRSFAYDTTRFQRSLRVYAAAIIGLAALGFLMLRTNAKYLPVVYILMFGAILALALMLAGPVPHLRSRHSVTGEAVILRHGLGFKLTIPFSNIALIKEKETSSKPGTRVDRADGTLYVIASGKGSIKIGLRETMAVTGGAFDTVILDVEDPGEFVSSVKERRKGEALMRRFDERPPAELRTSSGKCVRSLVCPDGQTQEAGGLHPIGAASLPPPKGGGLLSDERAPRRAPLKVPNVEVEPPEDVVAVVETPEEGAALEDTPEEETTEEEPARRPPQKERSARVQRVPKARLAEPPARIVRIPKTRSD